MPFLLAVVVAAAALWFALFGCYCYLVAAPTRRSRTRKNRRGGYVKQLASPTTNRVTIPQPLEPGTTGYISLRSALGTPSVGGVTLEQRLGRNRPTGHGSSGAGTADRGASGARRGFADCREALEEARNLAAGLHPANPNRQAYIDRFTDAIYRDSTGSVDWNRVRGKWGAE